MTKNTLSDALFTVRAAQRTARNRFGSVAEPEVEAVKARALKRNALRHQAIEPSWKGGIRIWGLRYTDVDREMGRIQRTVDMIERFEPGDDENPVFAERIARHAASLSLDRSVKEYPRLQDAILATTVEPYPTAKSKEVRQAGVIFVSSGLLQGLQVIADAVIAAWVPERAADGSAVSYTSDFSKVQASFAKNQSSVELLVAALDSLLFQGKLESSAIIPEEQWDPAQRVIVTAAERFVLGHEYGHVVSQPIEMRTGRAQELDADAYGLVVSLESLGEFDFVAPNMAMQGVFAGLQVSALIGRALSAVTGRPSTADHGSQDYPPFAERLEALVERYEHWVSGQELPWRATDLTPAIFFLDTLDLIWEEVELILRSRDQQKLHPVWSAAVLDRFLLS